MDRAIALDPNLANVYATLAETLSRVGRPEEAVRMAEQALHRKPDVVDFHLYPVGIAESGAQINEECGMMNRPLAKVRLSRPPSLEESMA